MILEDDKQLHLAGSGVLVASIPGARWGEALLNLLCCHFVLDLPYAYGRECVLTAMQVKVLNNEPDPADFKTVKTTLDKFLKFC